jgi:NADPH:quinone reductase-like Zn-dependent oxidoreductase
MEDLLMRAAVMTGYGKKHRVELRDMPEPQIREDEVLVKIHAASINPVDIKIRKGQMKSLLKYRFPQIMGNDIAGTVVRIGSRVTSFQPGDEVYSRLSKNRLGGFAEYVAVDEKDLALKPENTTFEEAAALPLVGLTVYQALVDIAKVAPGQKVFIKAGSGGVGTFAVQLAKALGAEVATTTSKANMDWVRKLGADRVIDYTSQKFEETLKDYDVVLDSVDNDNVSRAFSILKPGGHLVSVVGPPDAKFAREFALNFVLRLVCRWLSRKESRLARKTGVNYSFLFVSPSGERLTKITEYVESGKIKPVIDRVFALEQIHDALASAERGRTRGKIIIQIREDK